MSVQAGIWNFDGKPVDPKLLVDLTEALRSQGPDGEFLHVDGAVALLYRPFHTTAESRREKQPFHSRRGFVFTWDGRLDNRDDLIADLRGDLEAEPTDVAIVAAAFDRWGTDSFRRIVGDWAVSIWKKEQRELILAIDYMAIRHIFYSLEKEWIRWSTDLLPLVLLADHKFHIDDDYIAGFLANDADAHLTPYHEIREVPPGQFIRIGGGGVLVERYWRFRRLSTRYKTDAEYEEHFRHVFRQSVLCRLRSDSPVIAELSGGLDSSSIVCIAGDLLAEKGAQAPRLDTLSYYDQTEPDGDDWRYFPKVEEKQGKCGHHIDASKLGTSPASLESSLFEPLPGYLGNGRSLDAERGDIIRNGGYRVVLSGIGGDEFLGGIPDPRAQLADLIFQFRLASLARELIRWGLVKRRPWIHLLWESLVTLLPVALGQHLLKLAKVEPWIERDFANRTKLAIRLVDVSEHFGLWLPTRRSYVGGALLMANRMAKLTPPASTIEEGRYPYLDRPLLEFIFSIPASQLLRPGERRSLMRRALSGSVPQDILSRRTKGTSTRTPVIALEKVWDQLQSAFISPICSQQGYINRNAFVAHLDAARNGKAVHIARMLKTISLEFWLRDLSARQLIELSTAPSDVRSLVTNKTPDRNAHFSITPASK